MSGSCTAQRLQWVDSGLLVLLDSSHSRERLLTGSAVGRSRPSAVI